MLRFDNVASAIIGATSVYGTGDVPGVAYEYKHAPALWRQTATISPADGADGDGFGFSVAVSGATELVGAPSHVAAGSEFGAAYLYRPDR